MPCSQSIFINMITIFHFVWCSHWIGMGHGLHRAAPPSSPLSRGWCPASWCLLGTVVELSSLWTKKALSHDFNLKCYEETQVLTFSFTWVLFLDHVCHDIGSFCCSHGIGVPSHLSCVVADLIVDNIISHLWEESIFIISWYVSLT